MTYSSNLIEQAARRLEQLERAGVALPWDAAGAGLPEAAAIPAMAPLAPLPAAAPTSPASPVVPGASVSAVAPVAPHAAAAALAPVLPLGAVVRAPVQDRAPAAPRTAYAVTLDLDRLEGMGYLVPDSLRSELAEQFRHIKRPLLKIARGHSATPVRRARHIMVTSALPGEGKTFCSLNLAMSMAMEIDTAVILVDADVIRPSVFARYGLDGSAIAPNGLLDFLSGRETDVDQLLVATNVPKLTLMSTGRSDSRSSELLSSDAMDRLLDQLAERYPDHVVIFDAPPVLLTTESIALAGKAGQVAVVVESARTPQAAVRKTFELLRHCPSVSSVLNQCEAASLGDRYGYYYG